MAAVSVTARTRIPLEAMKAVYQGPGRNGIHGPLPRDENGAWGMETTLKLIQGIRITAEREPGEVLEYLNSLEKRFVIRGRLRRQLTGLVRSLSPPKLGRRVVYASHPEATHRVLVYSFYGRLVREYSMEDVDGEIRPLPAYERLSFKIHPLARVDVKPALSYLSGRYHDLRDYRDALARSAERLACEWWRRYASG